MHVFVCGPGYEIGSRGGNGGERGLRYVLVLGWSVWISMVG